MLLVRNANEHTSSYEDISKIIVLVCNDTLKMPSREELRLL